MSGEPVSQDAPQPTEAPAPVDAPAQIEQPQETQREIMARVFDSREEREARASAEAKPPGQPRSPTGQFATRPTDTNHPTDGNLPPAAQPAAAPEAPAGWSPEAKAAWSALPPDVQKHVSARESEFQTALNTHTEKLKGYDNLGRVLEPWRDVLTKGYGSAEHGIHTLLNLAAAADRDFPRFVVEQARARNISPEHLTSAFGTIPVPDPHTVALTRKVQELEGTVHGYQSAQEQAINSEAQRTIADFKSKPENKHFDKLTPRIGALLKAGLAQDLADAYRQAAAIDPEVAALIAKDKADADKALADTQARERQTRARTASAVNMRTGAPAQGAQPKVSQRELMERTYDRVNGTSH